MSNVDLSSIGISAETVAAAPAQEMASSVWESQAVKLSIKEAAVFKTASGATMFKFVGLNEEGREFTEYANTKYIAKKDDPNGKFKAGEQVENMSGVSLVTGIIAATGITDIGAKEAVFKAYANDSQAGTALTGLIGKVAIFGIREVNDPNSDFPESNEIAIVTDLSGNNKDGKEVLQKFKDLIAKSPVKKKKLKAGATRATAASGDSAEAIANADF